MSSLARPIRLPVLVLALSSLVHWTAPHAFVTIAAAKTTQQKQDPAATPSGAAAPTLPQHVQEMREAILTAVHSGRIEDLRIALEWNELKPDIGTADGDDPIAALKQTSGDGEGREILAVLGKLLDMAPAALPIGQDPENNLVYVWPYLAERPLDALTPAEEVDLYRLMPAAEARAMREKKKWTWWRLAIGADGTWHSFKKDD